MSSYVQSYSSSYSNINGDERSKEQAYHARDDGRGLRGKVRHRKRHGNRHDDWTRNLAHHELEQVFPRESRPLIRPRTPKYHDLVRTGGDPPTHYLRHRQPFTGDAIWFNHRDPFAEDPFFQS